MKRSVLAALVVVLVLGAGGARAAQPRAARLDGDTLPVAYDLTLAPDLGTMRTTGEETLDVRVTRTVDAIALNAREIDVRDASIDGVTATTENAPAIEQVLIRSGGAITPGNHRIVLRFASAIHAGNEPSGLFVSAEPNHSVLTALFEPSRARSVFPCFDEPAFRAPVTLHVRAPSAWTVVSNMPLSATRALGDGLAQSDFEPTPPISSYMLTLDAGELVHVDGVAGRVPIRVFVVPGREEHARAMLEDARRLLPFYESLFGTPFPLPKLDLVVAPGGLQTAFEGWGAITFYSEGLPFGTSSDPEERRRGAVGVLAHEMAHQWAGDLVTMRWWRDTFVAEGLAQFAQRAALRALFPELRPWLAEDRDVALLMQNPITAQSRAAVPQIRTDLNDDDWAAFNQAAYDKGASAIDTWRSAAGDAAFHARLHAYMRRFAYGSATFEQFWDAMGGREGVAYGTAWLTRRGFPIVDVRTGCARGGTTIALAQTPFTTDPHIDAAYRAQRWIVPISLRIGTRTRGAVLSGPSATLWIPGCGRVAVNPKARPYYAVRYADAAYEALARDAATQRERTRNDLDAALLHAAGALHDLPYLRVMRTVREPVGPVAWRVIANEYRRVAVLVRGTPESRTFTAMERDQLLPLVRRYGSLRSTERSSFQVGYLAAWALAEAGDPTIGAMFRDDYAAIERGDGGNYEAFFTTAVLVAAIATPADVDRAEAELRAMPASPMTPVQIFLLEYVGDETLARRVLADVAREPRLLVGVSRSAFVLAVGARHPQLGYAYLRGHLRELERELPPTQQAWILCTGTADALWPAAPPRELEAFLRARFPHDPKAVREASARIERHWAQRRSLVSALRVLAG
jgi:Peptidase family M1 domain/Peptidase M1 N-terminal domain